MDLVKWQDDDGGWHTGRIVKTVNGQKVMCCVAETQRLHVLVWESCTGELSWPLSADVEEWQERSAWEK